MNRLLVLSLMLVVGGSAAWAGEIIHRQPSYKSTVSKNACEARFAEMFPMTVGDVLAELPRGSERTDKIRDAWTVLNQALNKTPPADQAMRHELSKKMADLMAAEMQDAGYKVELREVFDNEPTIDGFHVRVLEAPKRDESVAGILAGVRDHLKTHMEIIPTFQGSIPLYGAAFGVMDDGTRAIALPFQPIVSGDVRAIFLNDGILHEIRHAETRRGLELGKASPYYVRVSAVPGKKISSVEGYDEHLSFDEMATYGKEIHQLLAGVPEMLGRDQAEMALRRDATLLEIGTASQNLADDALKSMKAAPAAVQFEMDTTVNRVLAKIELRDEKGELYGHYEAHLIAAKDATDHAANLKLLESYIGETKKVAEGHAKETQDAIEAYLKTQKNP